MGRYDDILRLSRPVSVRHPPMPRGDRAKQFMPFAALKGYDDAIAQREFQWQRLPEFSEEQRDALDRAIRQLDRRLRSGRSCRVRLKLFRSRDGSLAPGAIGLCSEKAGTLEKLSLETRALTIDGEILSLDEVLSIEMDPVPDA